MSDLIYTTGADCLNYIDKPIGLGCHAPITRWSGEGTTIEDGFLRSSFRARGMQDGHKFVADGNSFFTTLYKWKHNVNYRKVGLITGESSDGGLQVSILSNNREELTNTHDICDFASHYIYYSANPQTYTQELLPPADFVRDDDIDRLLKYQTGTPHGEMWSIDKSMRYQFVSFDNLIDYTMTFSGFEEISGFNDCAYYNGQPASSQQRYYLTNNKNTTFQFGHIYVSEDLPQNTIMIGNPLSISGGNLYNFLLMLNNEFYRIMPRRFSAGTDFSMIVFYIKYDIVNTFNFSSIPYNLLLTRDDNYAKQYLDNGTLPPDALLYPLDWDNLPQYNDPVPTGDTPEDYPDDNDPDDDDRDIDDTPTETPTFTVNQLTNYNWYWLTVPDWSSFINWFWNDIGEFADFSDIIAKVEGLYNDVASAVIMARYYPVDISWIGGLGQQANIKLGMIEKAGLVDTIGSNPLRIQDIGHIHIPVKYKSFMDMSPYSQLSLYLPWHGFIDLDINLFMGHDVYVKAVYDYLSGTIQYYIYYDNQLLVNTILCKMAMDIPITLQTKNDRDSAIFNNVSSTIGGLVGAGVGIASGNPIGMTLGATQGINAISSGKSTAPMRFMGNVGETGAYIGCQNCYIMIRRPTIQASDGNKSSNIKKALATWKHNAGMVCGYGYTLSDLSGCGFTTCFNPRINFTKTIPLQSEIAEIYDYLQKGVIL